MLERIKEIIGILDGCAYGKDCNFLQEWRDDGIYFYSRDYCHNISFRELLKWYLSRLYYNDYIQSLDDCDEERWKLEGEFAKTQEELYMELVDIYSQYKNNNIDIAKEIIGEVKEVLSKYE